MSLERFRERLAEARNEKGMTQGELAKKIGVTPQAVSKWERGGSYPDIEMLDAIATILDCSLDYLFCHQENRKDFWEQGNLRRRAEIEDAIIGDDITLQVGTGIVTLFMKANQNHFEEIHKMRVSLGKEYGLLVPAIRIRDEEELEKDSYEILIGTRKVLSKKLSLGEEEATEKEMHQIVDDLQKMILEHYDLILNKQIAADYISLVEKRYPKVVEGLVPEKYSLLTVKEILSGLFCRRHVPLTSMVTILESLEEQESDFKEGTSIEEIVDRIAARLE